MNITRREAVIRLALLMGASIAGPRLLAAGASETPAAAQPLFSPGDIALLDEIGETIIPTTHIPGAKAVGIGAFIAMMVTDCYTPRNQQAIITGVADIAKHYEARHGEKFIGGNATHRTEFLNLLDADQRKYTNAANTRRRQELAASGYVDPDPLYHYFRVLRELTILGYFSSELGSTQAVKYLEVPGRFDGDVPYKKGDEWFI